MSIPRRVGRHRTAALALSGVAIDADDRPGVRLVHEIAG